MIQSEASYKIHQQVASMYDRFPYPAYPLLARLQWWQAYLSSAAFSWALRGTALALPIKPRILLAGCGDTQPYIHRKLEPAPHELVACDLAKVNIQRARWRLLIEPKRVDWLCDDLLNIAPEQQKFDHIDCYGVLHHMANPLEGLAHLRTLMQPGATLRLMVYQKDGRNWIWQLRQIFQLLGLDYRNYADIKLARQIILGLSEFHQSLTEKLAGVNIRSIPDSHIVDRFFHAREARLAIGDWWKAFDRLGLQVLGVFDRYAELDDLPNPLWSPPGLNDLTERARDSRFENNLECYLTIPCDTQTKAGKVTNSVYWQAHWQRLHAAPKLWNDYDETSGLSRKLLWQLWSAHIDLIYQRSNRSIDQILGKMENKSIQRLARIGAIFPAQIQDKKLLRLATRPLQNPTQSLSSVDVDWDETRLSLWLEDLALKRHKPPSIVPLIIAHLKRIKRWSNEPPSGV